jgi:hypothetical protein
MVNYSVLPGLDGVYLEDSFVLGIGETSDELVFDLDAVLTPSHPSYAPPHPGDQYCYRRGALLFRTDKISWLGRSQTRFHDESGEEDLGNIDIFTAEGDHYYLEGDWGSVELESSERPRFLLTVT